LLHELPSFEHIEVKSVQEAISWLHKLGEKATVIAGGTDLLGMMKDRIEGPELKIPEVLVNIKTIPGMSQIIHDEEVGLRIGAAVSLNRLETSDVVRKKFTVLSEAARQVATTQMRNMGTIGGNICQRPRCLYFRHPDFICYKKGESKCYAATGEHRYHHAIVHSKKCVMAHPSDIAPVLVALRAKAVIASSEGEKQVPLEDFFLGSDYFRETVLKSDEMLTEVQVPNQRGRPVQFFLKHRVRHSSDFALASVATVAQISHEICENMRIVLGGISPFPYVASKAEEIIKGKRLKEQLISRAAEASVKGMQPLPMNRYKIDLTKALVRRVLKSAWHEATQA
jgi:xanthine dehydrogenase YagS FAD-binding subunit